jgi:hypothetical protein
MLALRLVRLIERHSEELARGLTQKIWESERTCDFRKIPPENCTWPRPRFTTTWESGCCKRQKRISRNGSEQSPPAGHPRAFACINSCGPW